MSTALVVEHLADRLERVLPGAQLIRTSALGADKGWSVITKAGQRVSGPSQREAIQRAEQLFGVQR